MKNMKADEFKRIYTICPGNKPHNGLSIVQIENMGKFVTCLQTHHTQNPDYKKDNTLVHLSQNMKHLSQNMKHFIDMILNVKDQKNEVNIQPLVNKLNKILKQTGGTRTNIRKRTVAYRRRIRRQRITQNKTKYRKH